MLCPGRALARPHGAAAAPASTRLCARRQRPHRQASLSWTAPPDPHHTAGKRAPLLGAAIYRDRERCSHWLRGSPFVIGCFFHRHYRFAWVSSHSHRPLLGLRHTEAELRHCYNTSNGRRAQWRSRFRGEGSGVAAREPTGRRELGGRVVAANGRARPVRGQGAAAGRRAGCGAAMTRSCSALGCTARDNGRSRERGISFHQ